MSNIKERIDKLNKIISNNEIKPNMNGDSNFKIFDYDPEDRFIVDDLIQNFVYENNKDKLILIDIYKTIIGILKEIDYIDLTISEEKKYGTAYSNKIIQDVLGIGTRYDDLLKEKIINEIGDSKGKIVILYGLEGCYQLVRGHTILSILEPIVTENSIIMLYPGTYDGQCFKLFNNENLKSDNGYNATIIVGQ